MAPTIPLDVADVTPEWLSYALGVEVEKVEVLDAHSGTTGRARIGLTSAAPRNDLPPSLFVKLAPFDPRQRKFVDMTGLGIAEARFYRDVAGDVPVRVPRVHHAEVDDDGRYVMVLEDLVASACRFPSPGDEDVGDSVAAIIDALAHLHARYWGSPRLDRDLGWVRTGGRVGFEHGGPYFARALEMFGDEMGPTFRRLAELYVEKAPAIAGLLAAGPPTLIHGDPHLGNLFLDGDDAGFFDWGMVWCATGVRDVAYVLGNSTPTEVRRAHEREWLGHYVEVIHAAGIDLDAGDAWERYRLLVVYAWSSATSTATMGSRWQTIEVGHGGMARATEAVEDLDSVPLLESLLA
jgi:hypothetical protein